MGAWKRPVRSLPQNALITFTLTFRMVVLVLFAPFDSTFIYQGFLTLYTFYRRRVEPVFVGSHAVR